MFDAFLLHLQGPLLSLWVPFLILLLCGLGLPLPEDIVLLVAGVLAAMEGRSWQSVTVIMYAAVLMGDSLIFLGGRRYGARLLASRLMRPVFSEAKRARVEEFTARHGAKSLFLARFLPGLRAVVFFSAGSLGVSYLKFLLLDGLAALISVPVFVWLGHFLWERFGDDLDSFDAAIGRVHDWSVWFGLALLMVLAVQGLRWYRRRRA